MIKIIPLYFKRSACSLHRYLLVISFVCKISRNISFSFVKQTIWKQPPHFSIAFMEKSVLTNVSGLRTPYSVTSGDDCGL
jgi:hypothetical protein